MTFICYTLRLFVNYPRVPEINIGYIIIINSLIFTIFAPITKLTADVSTWFVFKSSPEAIISPLFLKKNFTQGWGRCPRPRPSRRSGAMLPHISWLALGFLPNYATVCMYI